MDTQSRAAIIARANAMMESRDGDIDYYAPGTSNDAAISAILHEAGCPDPDKSEIDFCMGCGQFFDINYGHDVVYDTEDTELADELRCYEDMKVNGARLSRWLGGRNYCGNLACIVTDYRRQVEHAWEQHMKQKEEQA